MNLSEMEELKKEYQLDNKIISEQTGIPVQVLQNIFEGDLMSQEYNTLLSLGRYFRELQEKLDHVAEAYAYHAKKRQGNYTIEDYYDWPDDRRIELIDGVIYDMAAPSYIHQRIIVEILYQIEKYIREKEGKCEVLVAPFDVQLDKDHKTIVQPDILIVCDKDRIEDHRLYGAPDFAIEILSPSTKSKDMIIKFDKYKVAGVKEYWIIDPEERTVTVHDFANNLFSENYSFHDQIPVGIYEGKLKIDLTFIKE
ncbi:MAG: Uma2 family endonuclease [Hespellia sp.]|nr:Uma2 family endonuclease [Hespellia sp.]